MRFLHEVTPKEKRDEIVAAYLTGDKSYEELGDYYGVSPKTIRTWVWRHRKSGKVVSLQADSKPVEDMARKKKETENECNARTIDETELHQVVVAAVNEVFEQKDGYINHLKTNIEKVLGGGNDDNHAGFVIENADDDGYTRSETYSQTYYSNYNT